MESITDYSITHDEDYVKLTTVINDAIEYSAKYNVDTAVFKNSQGIWLGVYSLARDCIV